MSCHFDIDQPGTVYRIGRTPYPWALPDWRYAQPNGTFGNRWDDPDGVFRVGYASSQRHGTFIETLSRFRPDPKVVHNPPSPAVIDALIDLTGCDAKTPPPGELDVRVWISQRMMGQSKPRGTYADLRASTSLAELTLELSHVIISFGLTEIDGAVVRSPDRVLTQQISKYVFACVSDTPGVGRQYDGICYASRLGDDITNWALFEPVGLEDVSEAPIAENDKDLIAVSEIFGIRLV